MAIASGDKIVLSLKSEVDILRARKEGQRLAEALGMNTIESVKVATAISEIATNALFHAGSAEVTLMLVEHGKRRGISVAIADRGPGILDVAAALRDGFSTRRSLGIGLGAAKRLMDEFIIDTEIGNGTTITMTKWKA